VARRSSLNQVAESADLSGAVELAIGGGPGLFQNKDPMICTSKSARPPECIGTTGQRFDRRLCLAIGRQSAQRIVATHASHHDIALTHWGTTGHDGSRHGGSERLSLSV
jgi:hypothetical protein